MTQSRFSFSADGQPIEGAWEPTPAEMVAQFAAIDRSKIRRRSVKMDAPECRIDRNLLNRILLLALVVERESYKRRGRYQHRGALGDLGVDLLRVLMAFGRKHGKIFPCYRMLAHMLRKDPETIVEAMKRLIKHGFVTKHRRSKMIKTANGDRRVQDSNAYEVHLSTKGLASVPVVARKVLPSSDSENPSVSERSDSDSKGDLAQRDKIERWWLPAPYPTANGGWL